MKIIQNSFTMSYKYEIGIPTNTLDSGNIKWETMWYTWQSQIFVKVWLN